MDIELILKKNKEFVLKAPVMNSIHGSMIADLIADIEDVYVDNRNFADNMAIITGSLKTTACKEEIERQLILIRPLEFEKYGGVMRKINELPQLWTATDRIPTKEGKLAFGLQNIDNLEEIEVLLPRLKVGDMVRIETGLYNEVMDVQLVRLSDITNEEAERAGVEQIADGQWRHYCPEKMFPKDVLKQQEEGFPYMADARASYYTKWVKRYNVLDVASNPWVWRIEYKYLMP